VKYNGLPNSDSANAARHTFRKNDVLVVSCPQCNSPGMKNLRRLRAKNEGILRRPENSGLKLGEEVPEERYILTTGFNPVIR